MEVPKIALLVANYYKTLSPVFAITVEIGNGVPEAIFSGGLIEPYFVACTGKIHRHCKLHIPVQEQQPKWC